MKLFNRHHFTRYVPDHQQATFISDVANKIFLERMKVGYCSTDEAKRFGQVSSSSKESMFITADSNAFCTHKIYYITEEIQKDTAESLMQMFVERFGTYLHRDDRYMNDVYERAKKFLEKKGDV